MEDAEGEQNSAAATNFFFYKDPRRRIFRQKLKSMLCVNTNQGETTLAGPQMRGCLACRDPIKQAVI